MLPLNGAVPVGKQRQSGCSRSENIRGSVFKRSQCLPWSRCSSFAITSRSLGGLDFAGLDFPNSNNKRSFHYCRTSGLVYVRAMGVIDAVWHTFPFLCRSSL